MAITITKVYSYIISGTSVDWDILHGTDPTGGAQLVGTDVSTTEKTTIKSTTNFTGGDAAVGAGEALLFDSSAMVGDPTDVHLTVVYTED